MKTLCCILSCASLVAGCANAPKPGVAESYERACLEARNMKQLDVAERLCTRALTDAPVGTIGPERRSRRLYDLAQIKRQLGKFSEAEQLLNQSLALETKMSPVSPLRIARRQVELSLNLAGQEKWLEGAQVLGTVLPVTDQFNYQMKQFTAEVLERYAAELRKRNQLDTAIRFENASRDLVKAAR